MKKIYVTILLIFIQIQLLCACVSFSSGDWGDSSTWICGGSPVV